MKGCKDCELSHHDVSLIGDKAQGYSELFSKFNIDETCFIYLL